MIIRLLQYYHILNSISLDRLEQKNTIFFSRFLCFGTSLANVFPNAINKEIRQEKQIRKLVREYKKI